jgi:hypothetical protein
VDVIIEHAPAEIAASLLGALVAWLLVVLLNRLKDYRLRRRYPLSGYYLTRYEDVEDGKDRCAKGRSGIQPARTAALRHSDQS